MKSALLVVLATVPAVASPVSFSGRVSLGIRTTSLDTEPDRHYDQDTSAVAVKALLGARIDRFVVGIHGGLTSSSVTDDVVEDCCYSAENYPEAKTHVYSADLGLGATADIAYGLWVSGWIGAVRSSYHSHSSAQHINNISFYGDIPAASLDGSSTHLGFGGSVGFDLLQTHHGRGGIYLALERQDIGQLPVRTEQGYTFEGNDTHAMSYEAGLSFAY